jgi:glucose-1-phosphate thymidylyltransferase
MAVTAILLAAGYATRLYPLTTDRPKALLPLGEGVILDEIMAELAGDVTKRILVTNHRFAHLFRQWRADRRLDLEIIDDGTDSAESRLGAVRDLELARTQGGAVGDLLVIGTDNLFTWPLADFLMKARQRRPAPSVALWEAPSAADATQFGVVLMDADGRLTGFVEKSPAPPSRLVATCIYYFPEAMCGKIAEFVRAGQSTDAPGYLIKWLAERLPVYGVAMGSGWYDIGTIEAYEQVRAEWQEQEGV